MVMAHGIGAIKAGGLAPIAERFCREGFAAIVFDYRQWGGSTGQPARSFPFLASLKITASSLAGRPDALTLTRTEFLPGVRLSLECISSNLPRRTLGWPVRLAKFHWLTGSLRQ